MKKRRLGNSDLMVSEICMGWRSNKRTAYMDIG